MGNSNFNMTFVSSNVSKTRAREIMKNDRFNPNCGSEKVILDRKDGIRIHYN